MDASGKPIYYTYPYEEVINPICIMVYELEPGKDRCEKFEKTQIKFMSIIRESREVAIRCPLIEGGKKYVIVPSCKEEDQEGKFYLSLYFNQRLRQVNVKCLNDSKCRFFDIEEETETYSIQPKWKKIYIQRRLKYMIAGEDESILDESMI
mmetsp:Transcript_40465/g.38962  ORF Transcript_40465/g.38962 Transcript_40465/m.38962 type:complete len:151 (+) Transcript_40465:1625-2077(+)